MFDEADLVTLPRLLPGDGRGVPGRDTSSERLLEGKINVDGGAVSLNRNSSHVVEACAMAGGNVALAMSNGELCHANLSRARSATAELVPMGDRRWPHWTSWPTRHGKVLSLLYDPAHDALVTIEQATTAAGDQAFLGRYHRHAGFAKKDEGRDRDKDHEMERRGAAMGGEGEGVRNKRTPSPSPCPCPWVGCSVPLATNHAKVAVCARRGWAAVSTGSMVNLWAVARAGSETATSGARGGVDAQGRGQPKRIAPVGLGFEHALSVDLAELVGARGGMGAAKGKGGGVRYVALYGNLLAVATDHAMFLLHLSFDVKGEAPLRCGSSNTSTPQAVDSSTAPETPAWRGDAQSPHAASPQSQTHPPRSSPRETSSITSTSTSSARRTLTAPYNSNKSDSRASGAGGGRDVAGKKTVTAGADEGSAGNRPSTSKGGKGKTDRRDGVVEKAISEADDAVVCVLHPGGEGRGKGNGGFRDGADADGSSSSQRPPLPLLRAFDDDWKAFRARGRERSSDSPSDLEATRLATELFGVSTPLPVSGNSTVVGRVGGCEVVLARRVGPREVVKQLHLLPVSQSAGEQNRAAAPGESCRFVVLTSKGATVCLVRAARLTGNGSATSAPRPPSSSSASSASGSSPGLGPPPSPGDLDHRRSSFPPSPSSTSPAGQRATHARSRPRRSPNAARLRHPGVGVGVGAGVPAAGSVSGDSDPQQLAVFLRRSCRFNNDLVLASIASAFLFVLTVEGLEVWTLPSDKPQLTDNLPDGREEGIFGERGGGTPPLSSPPEPSARPCLLHVQRLEVDGVLPRTPARCMVPLGGEAPGLLLFPSAPTHQCASLAFLAQQCRRRMRSEVSADDPRGAGDAPISTFHKPSPTTNPFGGPANDAGNDAENGAEIDAPDSWQRKLTAWRHGFCESSGGEGAGVAAKATTTLASSSSPSSSSSSSPLALFLRLRTPTEAFCLLAKAEECSPRPLSATVSATFVSAAEGLHGALSMEAAAAWRDAVCPDEGGSGAGASGAGENWADDLAGGSVGGGATVPGQSDIEPILAGLAHCWRLQRVSARCASLLGRLLLETTVSVAENRTGRAGDAAAAGLAYTRACSWLLASGDPVQNSFARLKDVADRVSAIGDEMERTRLSVAPSFVFLSDGDADEDEDGDDDDDDEDSDSFLTTAGDSTRNLKELLPRAMYESYLLPSLSLGSVGVSDAPSAERASPIPVRDRDGQPSSFDDMLSGLVSYLHSQDMRQLSQRPGLRGLVDGVRRSTPLSTAVVYASGIPWASCPAALSLALAALDEQDKALAECNSSNLSTSSGSSGTSLSGRKTPPGVAKRSASKLSSKAPRGAELSRANSIQSLDNHGPVGDGSSLLPAQEWVVVARAILLGYSEKEKGENVTAGAAAPGLMLPAAQRACIVSVQPRLLQLACERHPALVVASSVRVGAGPLARELLNGGKAQPVVAALVNLTSLSSSSSCRSSEGRSGPGDLLPSFGPHRARDLLQLTDDCFSPPVDPLKALRVFGVSGRQIAARLDSLRRASLDLPGAVGFPAEARNFDFEGDPQLQAHEKSGDAFPSQTAATRPTARPDRSETKALAAAAREFLSQRCSSSLAMIDSSARHQQRLSQALGAPEAWQASFARNRALDRAILRFLISAHLDDLHALENSTSTSTLANPKGPRSSSTPTAGSGLGSARPSSSFRSRNRRDREGSSWADAIVPLLSGQVSGGGASGGPAEEHVDAILCLIRDISWRASRADGDGDGDGDNFLGGGRGSGSGCSTSQEEAEEVVREAKRRLPVSEPSLASASTSNSLDYEAPHGQVEDETQPWGSGGEEAAGGMRAPAPWPWGPRAVPASAVGAVLALAAALPPAGKLLAGIDVLLQVAAEVVAAAKSEAAVSAGAVAAASASAGMGTGKGGARARGGHASPKDKYSDTSRERAGASAGAYETHAGNVEVSEVSRAAERALLLYTSEHCGKDPEKWASVTEHVSMRDTMRDRYTGTREGQESAAGTGTRAAGSKLDGDGDGNGDGSVEAAGRKLVRALLRRCGEELGGTSLVRALPESLTLVECLDEVERSLLND